MIEILDQDEKPDWVTYPEMYLDLVRTGKDDFIVWYLMDRKSILMRYEDMKKRYPKRTLLPFARHDYTDDVACWELEKPGKVVLLHDYASEGYENKLEFDSFEDWHAYVCNLDNFADD